MSYPIPDCTVVSSCFSLRKYNEGSRSIDQTIANCKTLLQIPCYLVMFCNKEVYPFLKKIREEAGFGPFTEWKVQEIEEIWAYKYIEKVNKNREVYWPTRDPRANSYVHILCCNKPDFVLQVVEKNPFKTSKFAWLDGNLGENGRKISRNWNQTTFLHILHQSKVEKFSIQILNVVDKKYKQPEHKREYYQHYRWLVCGCLWIGGKEILNKLLPRVKEIFVETTNLGYGHGEEMLFLEVLDEFYNDIDRGYGDYQDILHNFIKPSENYYYLRKCIIDGYINHHYFKEAIDACKKMLETIEDYTTYVGPGDYIDILSKYFIATYQINPEESKNIAKKFSSVFKRKEYTEEFMKLDSNILPLVLQNLY